MSGFVQGHGPSSKTGFIMNAAAEKETAALGVEVIGDNTLMR